ncbi:Hypothetical_protein [Hexamita inflata]|uniref:Hypothetical_protein n=1 Tax=Hexamita inflata TaxID=28002 RepID=A0AA86UUP2_9EUKA|nr:Hypothetical protein HINF_LOCUS37803 [Hexamita inflata]
MQYKLKSHSNPINSSQQFVNKIKNNLQKFRETGSMDADDLVYLPVFTPKHKSSLSQQPNLATDHQTKKYYEIRQKARNIHYTSDPSSPELGHLPALSNRSAVDASYNDSQISEQDIKINIKEVPKYENKTILASYKKQAKQVIQRWGKKEHIPLKDVTCYMNFCDMAQSCAEIIQTVQNIENISLSKKKSEYDI